MMLSLRNIQNPRQAATYFEHDDYYLHSQQTAASGWWGAGAKALGLRGRVERKAFSALLEGRLPTGTALPQSDAGTRRAGFDLTFSAPKSVSLLALVHDDHRVLRAHQQAVARTLTELEQRAAYARITHNRITKPEATGNLTVALFHHATSRKLDPQLHTHAVVLNLTRRSDRQWRALDNEPIYRTKMLAGAIYRSELAHGLRRLGYEVERTHRDGRFEVQGFSKADLRPFSQRREEMEAAMKQLHVRGAIASERVALATRTKKVEVERTQLHQVWTMRAQALGIRFDRIPKRPVERSPYVAALRAQEGVRFAAAHLTERDAVFAETDLLRYALGQAPGDVRLPDVLRATRLLHDEGLLVVRAPGPYETARSTTHEMIELERTAQHLEAQGRDQSPAILTVSQTHEALKSLRLTQGQKASVTMLLTTQNQMVGIQGYAGTGKTTALQTFRQLAESEGYTLRGLAPSASAALVLENEAGIPSTTVARHLSAHRVKAPASSAQPNDRVLWLVDESSLLGTRQAVRLLQAARRTGARVALIGDEDQLPSIEAGHVFHQLMANGMETAHMTEILRQQNPSLRSAVQLTIQRKHHRAVEQIAAHVYEVPDRLRRLEAVAQLYLDHFSDNPLVLTASREDREALNQLIRVRLQKAGRLAKKEVTAPALIPKDLTAAERRDARSYEPGDIVRFEKAYRTLGIASGDLLTVIDVLPEPGRVKLQAPDGRVLSWDPNLRHRVEAHTLTQRPLAVGDIIRWTRNDHHAGRRNGETSEVLALRPSLRLAEVRVGSEKQTLHLARPEHWDHAYASTVHAAQGKTCNLTILHIDDDQRNLIGHESWYVALSRARHQIEIVCSRRDLLPTRISRSMEKEAALNHAIR
jgi:conjugative relaxase-like TrwC/TraI family protein